MKKNLLITGGSGFLGINLALRLRKKYNVFIGSRNQKRNYDAKLETGCEAIPLDVTNIESVRDAVIYCKPDIIIHMAAQSLVIDSYKNPYHTFDVNFMGTLNLIECIKRLKIKRSLIITSDKVYKNSNSQNFFKESDQLGGDDPYSASKASVEILVNSFAKSFFISSKNIHIATARAGNVVGGGDWSKKRLIPDFFNCLYNNQVLSVRNSSHTRPWQHVLDPLVGYLLLAKKQHLSKINGEKNNSWNFGPNKNNFKKVIDVVKFVQKLEKFKFSIDNKKKLHETAVLKLDSSKAKDKLNWSSKWNLSVALKKTLEWNNSLNKEISPEKKCVQQFLMYMNSK